MASSLDAAVPPLSSSSDAVDPTSDTCAQPKPLPPSSLNSTAIYRTSHDASLDRHSYHPKNYRPRRNQSRIYLLLILSSILIRLDRMSRRGMGLCTLPFLTTTAVNFHLLLCGNNDDSGDDGVGVGGPIGEFSGGGGG